MKALRAFLFFSLMISLGDVCRAAEESNPDSRLFRKLSSGERAKVDSRALALTAETGIEQQAEFYGDVAGWMISRMSLPVEEEACRAAGVHEAILQTAQVVESSQSAEIVLRRLVEALPEHMRPAALSYSLTVIDEPDMRAWTVGGGYVYISKPYLDALLIDGPAGRDRLAFVLAHELGHICRGHCRRGYQLVRVQRELDDEIEAHIHRRRFEVVLKSAVKVSGKLVTFLYSSEQNEKADLFALHLCRNAGFEIENGLDVLRHHALNERPEKDQAASSAVLSSEPPKHPAVLRRLQRLRLEWDGRVDGEEYGLFEFDRQTGHFTRLADASLAPDERAITFVHGIDSHFGIYDRMVLHLAGHQASQGVRILGFHYPNDDSLARSGRFLQNEIKRVCGSGESIDFICHSAGGLLFRYYAEVSRGAFRRAVLQGTPHAGSDLAKLRVLLETKQFLGNVRFGIPHTLENALQDGKGQISFDLQPESLFLRFLSMQNQEEIRDRYYLFRGRAISGKTGVLLLETGMAAARMSLRRRIEGTMQPGLLAESALSFVDELRVPREFLAGDMAVTLESAALEGVGFLATYPVHHIALLKKQEIVEAVTRIVLNLESIDTGNSTQP